MSLSKEKLKVSKITVEKNHVVDDKRPVRGSDWFPNTYSPYINIGIFGKKRSGKSNILRNIVRKVKGKNTKFIVICSTMLKDPNMKQFINDLETAGNDVLSSTSIIEDDENIIQGFLEDNEPEENLATPVVNHFVQSKEPVEKKEKKPKYKPLEYIIIFDDMAKEQRDKYVEKLVKTNFHNKCMVIFSTQELTDLTPDIISQLDYLLIFPGMTDQRLKETYDKAHIGVDFEEFSKLYKDATSKPYNFLYYSKEDNSFRHNFNERYK